MENVTSPPRSVSNFYCMAALQIEESSVYILLPKSLPGDLEHSAGQKTVYCLFRGP